MKSLSSISSVVAGILLLCFLPFQEIRAQQTLIIGSSSKAQYNVTQFDSLLKEIAAGNLTGQLVMAFESGTYPITNALVVNSAKFTAKDHLTITSVAKNRDSVIFSYNGSIAAVQLNSTQNVTFSHITISSTKTSGCHAVGINGPVSNVLFYQCAIAAPATGTAGTCCPIGTASTTAATDKGSISATVDRLHFVGNIISGGCRGIWLNGTATNHLTNIRIDSNEILNSYDVDANINYCDTVSFVANLDIPRPGINGNHYGITLSNCVVESFSGNFINYAAITQATHTGVVLTLSNCTPASGKRFPVANNVVIGKTAIGYRTTMGHLATMSNIQADILHNSLFNNRITTNTTYSVNCLNVTGAASDVRVIGNMLATIDSSEFPLRIDTTTGAFFTDYNNYWSNNGFLARDNSNNYRSMTALQAFTKGDKYSLSIAPQWVDSTQGLQLTDYSLFVIPNQGLANDFDGANRGASTAIGAYAGVIHSYPYDLAMQSLLSPDANAIIGTKYPLTVVIRNAGDSAITSATIRYTLNQKAGADYKWKGNLAKNGIDTVTLDQVALIKGNNDFMVVVTDPNGKIDSNSNNDTLQVRITATKDPLDAALVSFIGLNSLSTTGTHPISAVIRNVGPQPVDSATLQLFINQTACPAVRYLPKKALPQNGTDTVLLGSFTIPGGNVSFKACLTVKGDGNPKNDTITTSKYVCSSAVGGRFVIGNSNKADYSLANLDTLFSIIRKCGGGNNITLAFESGTYTLSKAINWNTDFMQGGTLTVTSIAQNRDSVIFSYAGSIGAVQLNNMSNVTFSHVTIRSTATSGCHTICFNGPTENIAFLHCNIESPASATAGSGSTIGPGTTTSASDNASLSFKVRNITFIDDTIRGGCRNIILGTATNRLSGLRVEHTAILGAHDGILRINYIDSVIFKHNTGTSRNAHNQNSAGVHLNNITCDSIYGNFIDMNSGTSSSAATGCVFNISGTNLKGGKILVANNVIISHVGGGWRLGTGEGRVVRLGGKIDFLYNSIYNNNTAYATSPHTAGVKVLSIGDSAIRAVGNIIACIDSVNQFPLGVDALAAGKVVLDYNDYWNGGGCVAYYNNNPAYTIAGLQIAGGGDAHSFSTDPNFKDFKTGLALNNYGRFLMPNLGVGNDFNDSLRNSITSMGAYTAILKDVDAALTDFATTDIQGGKSSPVYVTLMNCGLKPLTSVTIEWTANGVKQTSYAWTGNLATGATQVLQLGSVTAAIGSMFRISAWTTKPNQTNDMVPQNDTISTYRYICASKLSGTYTVGGSNPDFLDFEEAVYVLHSCGISGPVTLKMRAGTYGHLTVNGMIPGSSDSATITVCADSNAKVTFDGGSTESGLTLKDAAHWVFEGITFGNTSNGLYGVVLEGANRNILIRRCNINASTTATTASMAVYFQSASNSGSYPVDVRFISNNIRGGVANIHMYYMAGSTANMPAASVAIIGNTMSDAYQYGIYSYYYSHYSSISRNSITSRTGSGNYYGMYLYYYNNVDTLDANRIHINASSGYGIYSYYYFNYSSYGGKMGTISNNEIMIHASSTVYGIYMYYPYQTWNIYNNSILAETSGSVAYGAYLYNTSTSYKIHFRNNLTMAKATSAYPVYVSSATYVKPNYMTFDWNLYYGCNTNDTATNVGYAGSVMTTLADWQTATTQDSNSYNGRPAFTNSTVNLELNDYSTFSCPRLPEAAYDILGTPRGPIASVGCYSLEMFDDFDLSAKKIVQPVEADEIKCFGDFAEVAVSIQNRGRITADFSQNPLSITLLVTGASTFRKDTLISYGLLGSALTDTIRFGRIPTMASGIYHLQVILNDTADHHPEDDTLYLDYNVSHVELPYDVNFTTAPTEFVNINRSGNTGWEVTPQKGDSIAPAFGTGFLKFSGTGHPGNVSDAVFNSVNIYQTSNPKLSFWFAHTDEATRDFLSIQVTTDEGATFTELGKVAVYDTGVCWKQYDFDLSKFTNDNCISILFQAVSFGSCNQYIDRIRITADKDMAIRLLMPDPQLYTACHLQQLPLKVVVENQTRSNVPVSDDTIRVSVTGAANQQFVHVYNKMLGGFESDTITITGQWDLSANGAYYVEACMQAIDDNSFNDTIRDSSLIILQDVAMDSVLGLDNQMYKLGGEQVAVTAVVTNNGNIPVDQVLLHMSIDGNTVLTDTVRQHLGVGDTLVHPMSRTFTVPFVSKDQPYYFFELKADLACDADNSNDAIQIIGNVEIPDSIDIQVLEITTTDQALGKTKLAPTVRVANIGNLKAENIVVHVEVVNDSNRVVESISEMISHLAENETRNHAFTMTYKVPNYTGKYTLKAYVEAYSGDTIRSNDTLAKQFRCYRDSVGIREATGLDWQLGQNIPNPAAEITAIPFTLPKEGRVRFSVMTANGQVIYRQEIQGEAGGNRLELHTGDWANGLYYYTMEYRGQRITRKMNIIK